MDENSPYQIIEQDDLFMVQDVRGEGQANTILALRDRRNAEHYLTLLNKAYMAGYKAGFKEGKNS